MGGGRRRRREHVPFRKWRSLSSVLAEHQRHQRTGRALPRRLARAVALASLAAVLAAPFALAWGFGHARTTDYLGPHRVEFLADYTGEIRIDLGPLGNAYVPSPAAPIGVHAVVGSTPAGTALFSEQTLAEYASLYTDPGEAAWGIAERLTRDALDKALLAELLLLAAVAAWLLRRRLIAPALLGQLTRRRVLGIWALVTAVVLGSILVPAPSPTGRSRLSLSIDDHSYPISVDSELLASVLDRGVKGIRLLSERQQQAMARYLETARANLFAQHQIFPAPLSGGDDGVRLQRPALQPGDDEADRRPRPDHPTGCVFSSGDDTVNGTAAERACVSGESTIGDGAPMLVATGNHDSDTTEAQLRSAGMTVLDGAVVGVETPDRKLTVLGDDDPEHNIPFSVERRSKRRETEEQLGQRLVAVAGGKPVDVILVHQPTAANVIMTTPDPPARLVLWGHMHAQQGPVVVRHADGSWTVGMQEGTSGGVRQPTLTTFSTPFSAPLTSADVYFYFVHSATGLVVAVQPVHFKPDGSVVIDHRIVTGTVGDVPVETRAKLGDPSASATPASEVPSAEQSS